jgi:hypothetical protein
LVTAGELRPTVRVRIELFRMAIEEHKDEDEPAHDEDFEGPFLFDSVTRHFSFWRLIKHFLINAIPHVFIWLPFSNWEVRGCAYNSGGEV